MEEDIIWLNEILQENGRLRKGGICDDMDRMIRLLVEKPRSKGIEVFGLARFGSTMGFHLLWHTAELAMSSRLCLL